MKKIIAYLLIFLPLFVCAQNVWRAPVQFYGTVKINNTLFYRPLGVAHPDSGQVLMVVDTNGTLKYVNISGVASWGVNGNNLSSDGNFIGTTGPQDLVMKANSVEGMRLQQSTGRVGINNSAPNKTLDVNGTFHVQDTLFLSLVPIANLLDTTHHYQALYFDPTAAMLVRDTTHHVTRCYVSCDTFNSNIHRIDSALAAGGGGANIYNIDGVLTGDRLLQGNNKAYELNLEDLAKFGIDNTNQIDMSASTTAKLSANTKLTLQVSSGTLEIRPSNYSSHSNGDVLTLVNSTTGQADWATPSGGGGGWSLTGNSATTSSNFLGTTDNKPLELRSNNLRLVKLFANGHLGLGAGAPGYNFIDIVDTTNDPYNGISLRSTTRSGTYSLGSLSIGKNNAKSGGEISMVVTDTVTLQGSSFVLQPGSSSWNAQNAGIFMGNNGIYDIVSINNSNPYAKFYVGGPNYVTDAVVDIQPIAQTSDTSGKAVTIFGQDGGPANNATGTKGGNIVLNGGAAAGDGTPGSIYLAPTSGGVGVGMAPTDTPTAKMDIIGTLKVTDGSQAANRVFTSDANGLGHWQAFSGAGWSLTGNGGTDSANFLGTTDNKRLLFKTNNKQVALLDTTGTATFGPYKPYNADDVSFQIFDTSTDNTLRPYLFRAHRTVANQDITHFVMQIYGSDPYSGNISLNAQDTTGTVSAGSAWSNGVAATTATDQIDLRAPRLTLNGATQHGKLGINVNTPNATVDITGAGYNGTSDYVQTDNAPILNDATYGGAIVYPATPEHIYFTVTIDGEGSPDTYSFQEIYGSFGSGSNIPIDGTAQVLADGITITFGNTTGHVVGDQWTYDIRPNGFDVINAATSNGSTIFQVKNNSRVIVNGDLQIPSNSGTGKVLTSDADGVASWQTSAGISDTNRYEWAIPSNKWMSSSQGNMIAISDDSGKIVSPYGNTASVTAFGYGALQHNLVGNENTAIGRGALGSDTTGSLNTAVGSSALSSFQAGRSNTAIGQHSGQGAGNYMESTFLGANTGTYYNTPKIFNVTLIGANAYTETSNTLILGSVAGQNSAIYSPSVGIGTIAPEYTLDIRGSNWTGVTNYHTTNNSPSLNDATFSGTINSADPDVVTVTIDGTGSPDTYSWSANSGQSGSGIPIDGNLQYLFDSVYIQFGSTTGHSIGDQWVYTSSPVIAKPFRVRSASGDNITVNDSGFVGINNYNPTTNLDVNGSIKIHDGTQGDGKVLTSDGNGKASWQFSGQLVDLQYEEPTDGATVTSNGAPYLVLNAANVSNTVTFPPFPNNGQLFNISSIQAIASITLDGGSHTISGTLPTISADISAGWIYAAAIGTWVKTHN